MEFRLGASGRRRAKFFAQLLSTIRNCQHSFLGKIFRKGIVARFVRGRFRAGNSKSAALAEQLEGCRFAGEDNDQGE